MTDSAKAAVQKITAAFNDRSELCGPFDDDWIDLCMAAAFRAAADGVKHHWDGMKCADYLCSIAAELEAQP